MHRSLVSQEDDTSSLLLSAQRTLVTHRPTCELKIAGMDCAGCARTVQSALERVPGVLSADVLLGAEKAVVQLAPEQPASPDALRQAVEAAGYRVHQEHAPPDHTTPPTDAGRRTLGLLVGVFGLVLAIAVAGHWLGLFEALQTWMPWPVGLGLVLAFGYPIFKKVIRATWQRQVLAHTLMTVGVVAALLVGAWVTAAVIVLFMRIGDYVEAFTSDRARQSVRSLMALAPQTARVERDGVEHEVPVQDVQPDDLVVVRPGERIPVDGVVVAGQATVDQAAITGESMPMEAEPGTRVYAATIARLGSLRVRTERAGIHSTFGRVIRMVEEAEAHRGRVQHLADRFSGYYLPVVLGIAVLTFVIGRDVMAAVAVLVVACSCAFALATPVAVLAAVGAGAQRGLLIRGGRSLEALARADVLLLDKTGTLTLGQPQITDIRCLNGLPEEEVLRLAATAERYSEHPLAEAVRRAAAARAVPLAEPQAFEAVPGQGVRARVDGHTVVVGNQRLMGESAAVVAADSLHEAGKTLLFVEIDGEMAGLLAAADTERAEVHEALRALADYDFSHIELLTGDTERSAAALAERLGLAYRAELLPEDKIAVVRHYQEQGHIVVMVGDGVNDAPALAQADVGIAMGGVGTDVAISAAHVVLMREDWHLVPEAFRMARRTMRIVKGNLGVTTLYNATALSLAAFGLLPPVIAAALHAVPDLTILANSSRLLRALQSAPETA